MSEVERYDLMQWDFQTTGPVTGVFWREGSGREQRVRGFCSGAGSVALRFMPDREGLWHYRFAVGEESEEGSFFCTAKDPGRHGMVRAGDNGFRYDDGTRFLPFGTTCYAWIHQPEPVRRQTLESLKNSPFNKVRMLVFPKDMIYNKNEPEYLPFERDEAGWRVEKPVQAFWENLDDCLSRLDKLGIEADLILFHPYDRWGLAELTREQSLAYTAYVTDRYGAYRNVWWSLANEYDLIGNKEQEDWEEIAGLLSRRDPYGHLRSIHHCLVMYPGREWMTHVSSQAQNTEKVLEYRFSYGVPAIIDECGYEGNIEFGWGNLSARELVHRIWTAVIRGGYASHGETFYREDEVLWWAKGGELCGDSPARIAFLREILEGLEGTLQPLTDFETTDPNGREEAAESPFAKAMMKLPERQRNEQFMQLLPQIIRNRRHVLQYLGRACQAWLELSLPEGVCRVEVIDTWDMTRVTAMERARGNVRVELPGKEGMAVLVTVLQEDGREGADGGTVGAETALQEDGRE